MATIELGDLFFRISKAEWDDTQYVHEIPGQAYMSRRAAEEGLPEDHIVVTWGEMASRVYRDIRHDA